MNLLKIAKPAVTIGPDASVLDAIKAMKAATVGAVLIIHEGELKGVFTERDLMVRVVLEKKDLEATGVTTVMTSPVLTILKDTRPDEALKLMWNRHIRHLPVVDSEGHVQAMVSIRHLLHDKVEHLTQELDSLEAFIGADGIGG
jgi:CBS domain-containing protein